MSNSKITVKNLYKSFGTKEVLKDISLDIKSGESLVVIGGSGCGKSVLIKNIIGLMKPTSGTVLIDGDEMSGSYGQKKSDIMRKFGMLFQGGALFDSMQVWQNIAFVALQEKTLSPKDCFELAVKKLATVGLKEEVANLYPVELSGGMQKRVALARAIAHKPEIIFFDEPTTGLDPIMADVINDLIIKCSKELGATTLTITHDMHSVRKIANNVAMLHEGRIIWYGPVDKLDNSDNEYVDQFIHGRAVGPIQMKIQDH